MTTAAWHRDVHRRAHHLEHGGRAPEHDWRAFLEDQLIMLIGEPPEGEQCLVCRRTVQSSCYVAANGCACLDHEPPDVLRLAVELVAGRTLTELIIVVGSLPCGVLTTSPLGWQVTVGTTSRIATEITYVSEWLDLVGYPRKGDAA